MNEQQYNMYNTANNYAYYYHDNNGYYENNYHSTIYNNNLAPNQFNADSNQSNMSLNYAPQPHTPEIFVENDKGPYYPNNREYEVIGNKSYNSRIIPKPSNIETNYLNHSVNYNRNQSKDLMNHNTQLSHSFQSLSVENKTQKDNLHLTKPIANNSSSISLPQKLEPPKVTKNIESNKSFKQYDNKKSKSQSKNEQYNAIKSVVNIMNELNLVPQDGFNFPDLSKLMAKKIALHTNPSVMHVTLSALPATDELLSKSRLPLGILLQPFRDISSLPVIRAHKSIVRCRTLSCRAYLNPFIPFYDSKRWKCNMCLRINDLSDLEQLTTRFSQAAAFKHSNSLQSIIPEFSYSTYEYTTPVDQKAKPVKPPIFIFLIDLTNLAHCKMQLSNLLHYLSVKLTKIPGDNYIKFSLICYSRYINLYQLSGHRFREITITHLDSLSTDALPVIDGLANNIRENKEAITELFENLSSRIMDDSCNVYEENNCLGSALHVVKLLLEIYHAPARVTIFNSSRPSIGEGIVADTANSTFPTIDFYKTLGLDLAQLHVGLDMFQLGKVRWDLSSVAILTRYGGGSLYYYPSLFTPPSSISSQLDRDRLKSDIHRYLTRKIGFDAVLRVRYSSGITVQASYGNMFARACDLYSVACMNPDWTTGIRLGIDETGLSNIAYIQSALLYTSVEGEKRIRVHTICLPVSTRIDDIFRYADSRAILGLIAKMVSDRIMTPGSSSNSNMCALLQNSREGLLNSILDPLTAYTRHALSPPHHRLDGISLPFYLRLLPLFIWAFSRYLPPLPRNAKSNSNTPYLINEILHNCAQWRNGHLSDIITYAYPSLYRIDGVVLQPNKSNDEADETPDSPDQNFDSSESSSPCYSSNDTPSSSRCSSPVHEDRSVSREVLGEKSEKECDEVDKSDYLWKPIQLQLNNRNLECDGAYLIDMNYCIGIIICEKVSKIFLNKIFGISHLSELYMGDGSCYMTELPQRDNSASQQLRAFIKSIQYNRPFSSSLVVIVPSLLTNTVSFELLDIILYSSLLENSGCMDTNSSVISMTIQGTYLRFLQFIQKKLLNDIS